MDEKIEFAIDSVIRCIDYVHDSCSDWTDLPTNELALNIVKTAISLINTDIWNKNYNNDIPSVSEAIIMAADEISGKMEKYEDDFEKYRRSSAEHKGFFDI